MIRLVFLVQSAQFLMIVRPTSHLFHVGWCDLLATASLPFIWSDYSQCIPGTATTTPTTTTTTRSTTTTSKPPAGTGKLKFAGVNIAGFDFGCNGDGSCTASAAWPPLTKYYGADGEGQMQHFINDDGFNTFRLPVGWQFLTNNVMGGPIVAENLVKYDDLVQACLRTGAYCIIDIHNYARWDKAVSFFFLNASVSLRWC